VEEKELSTTLETEVFQVTNSALNGYYSYRLSTSCDFVWSKMFRYMHLLTILCEAFMRLFKKNWKEGNKL